MRQILRDADSQENFQSDLLIAISVIKAKVFNHSIYLITVRNVICIIQLQRKTDRPLALLCIQS